MAQKLRWGVLGTGGIARKFAAQLPGSERGELVAVGSRNEEAAIRFANELGGAPRSPYAGLLADEHVDAVYNALPNSMHGAWTLQALAAGKHVLCEKPVAANAAEAERMFAAAQAKNLVLVEAFMYRAHPAVKRFIQLAREGAVGTVKIVRSHFTYRRAADPSDVRYQPLLAGGSIMDVGCYCVNFMRAIVGREPTAAAAVCRRHETGVDEFAAGTLDFDKEAVGVFTCGMTVEADRHTFVGGSEGWMRIDTPWFTDGRFTVVRGDKQETIEVDEDSDQYYALEADAFAATVQDGAAPSLTAEDSINNMKVLDQLRASAGLEY